MTAAPAGWGSETVPVGGGGAVCERLCEAWRGRDDVRVTVLGTGPRGPHGVASHRLENGAVPPTALSEMDYAAMCRRFERACTDFVLAMDGRPVVIAHDISEGPTVSWLRARDVPVVVLVHVDVVEYFTRMYMRGWISPQRAVKIFEALRPWPVVPDVLRLVFDKQWDCARHASTLVLPSASMAGVLTRCYGTVRSAVVEWGAPDDPVSPDQVNRERERLRGEWRLREGERVLLTLSRISPEKGQDRLLRAVRHAERSGAAGPNFRVVICGAPAFMQGERFMRRLRRLAARLRTPVVFAGHLRGAAKRAALELADLFVAPSRHESYGLTTMEAFAAGAPVVAVDSHGARATVDDSCGRVIAAGPRVAERLWMQIETMLRNEPLRRGLADGARRRAASAPFSGAAEQVLALAREASIR